MKKIFITFTALAVFLSAGIVVKQTGLFAETVTTEQESARNRELLEIWKEHVKTLTKERDDAYRQLEQLKAGSATTPAGQFGVESMPVPSPAMTQQMEGLQSEVTRLQTALQRKGSSEPNRELQMQFSALENQYQQAKKELNEARNEKDRLIQEKERALAQVESLQAGGTAPSQEAPSDAVSQNIRKAYEIQKKRYEELQQRYSDLEKENESIRQSAQEQAPAPAPRIVQDNTELIATQHEAASLRDENGRLQSEVQRLRQANSQLSSASGDPEKEQEAYLRQAKEIQYENETLKAHIEKLEVVQKELASTRGYFTPLVKDLQDKNDKLTADNAAARAEAVKLRDDYGQAAKQVQELRSQTQQFQKEGEKAVAELEETKTQSQRVEADLRSLQSEREQWASQLESYKSQLQTAANDREKYRGIEQEYNTLRDRNESLQRAYGVLENSARANDGQVRDLSSKVASLEQNNRELAARQNEHVQEAEKYKAALTANLADMKNLKDNFQAYLESLVASFEERQK